MPEENKQEDHMDKDLVCCTCVGRSFSGFHGTAAFLCCALSIVSSVLGGIVWF